MADAENILIDLNALARFKADLEQEMANEKTCATTNTTSYWDSHRDYVPAKGEMIVYSDYHQVAVGKTTQYIPNIKIGDGDAYVIDLPFVYDDTEIKQHLSNTNIHITTAERTFWNNKLNCTVSGEQLIFNRN